MGRKTSKGGRGRSMEPNVLLLANPYHPGMLHGARESFADLKDECRSAIRHLRAGDRREAYSKLVNAARSLGFLEGYADVIRSGPGAVLVGKDREDADKINDMARLGHDHVQATVARFISSDPGFDPSSLRDPGY